MNVIPAILVKNKKEFKEKIKLISKYSDIFQIDVMDGKFVPNITWADTDIIEHMHLPLLYEAHLMIEDPYIIIEDWVRAGAFRIIFHIESTKKALDCIKKIKKYKKEAGVAINPNTSIIKIKDLLLKLDYVLVMGVTPGFSGQKFQPQVLAKIKKIKKLAPNIVIAVDGGVNLKNAKEIKKAGADIISVASTIFKAKDPGRVIEKLESI